MAVINLLDNAVKYSPPGSRIYVEVEYLKSEVASAHYARLAIKDEGPGIYRPRRVAYSIVSIGSMKVVPAMPAEPGWVWQLPNGQLKHTAVRFF